MKAILINAVDRTVVEVQVTKTNTLADWYKLLCVEMVEIAHYLTEHDQLIVDEEGLLKDVTVGFDFRGCGQDFLAGNGLIVGTDEDGEAVDCDATVEEIKDKVRFYHATN